jgi:hypothetical protein
MNGCNEIKRRIDEADDPESCDLDISRHTAACGDCRRFADERAALRTLLASTSRVTAPLNFDAVLQARLAEVKARKSFGWLGAPVYLRAGAVAAGLVLAVFAAQLSGLFSAPPTSPSESPTAADLSGAVAASIQEQLSSQFFVPQAPASVTSGIALNSAAPAHVVAVAAGAHASNRLRAAYAGDKRNAGVPLMAPIDAAFVDGGAILIPGKNGGRDITVPTVSVGAQPMIYVNAGRQPQPARAASVSF